GDWRAWRSRRSRRCSLLRGRGRRRLLPAAKLAILEGEKSRRRGAHWLVSTKAGFNLVTRPSLVVAFISWGETLTMALINLNPVPCGSHGFALEVLLIAFVAETPFILIILGACPLQMGKNKNKPHRP